jgi:DNA uptake protein ComE-like DNA-binding protein
VKKEIFRLAGTLVITGIFATGCNRADDTAEIVDGDSAAEAPASAPATPASAPAAASEAAFVDPNTAPPDQLLTVPGVDQTLANSIVAGRPFENMLAVDQAVGDRLSDEQKDLAYARLWMPLDLNTASEEEILLIPGVGDRMAHEFEEYRPYDAIERFRREIGKYVDPTEVARLERYVTIR